MIGSELIYHILEVFLNSEKYLWGKRLRLENLGWGSSRFETVVTPARIAGREAA